MIVGSMKVIIYPNGNSKICIELDLADDINYSGSSDKKENNEKIWSIKGKFD
jgi:hypothetical protein